MTCAKDPQVDQVVNGGAYVTICWVGRKQFPDFLLLIIIRCL